jgi:hypothetical protein
MLKVGNSKTSLRFTTWAAPLTLCEFFCENYGGKSELVAGSVKAFDVQKITNSRLGFALRAQVI